MKISDVLCCFKVAWTKPAFLGKGVERKLHFTLIILYKIMIKVIKSYIVDCRLYPYALSLIVFCHL